MTTYFLYDMKKIAKRAHEFLPQYTEQELMSWSIPDIIEYLKQAGHVLFGEK